MEGRLALVVCNLKSAKLGIFCPNTVLSHNHAARADTAYNFACLPLPSQTITGVYLGGFASHGMVLCAKKIVDGEEKVATCTTCCFPAHSFQLSES